MNPGTKLGPFLIEKELGSGAMGTVYLAQYKDRDQRVAIKMMAPGIGTSDTSRARFERESTILKQLKHENIVKLLATGRYKNSPFYAMEFIEGESLDHVMERRGRLTWEAVIELGIQLCGALQHAHNQGIVHRDLKPSNIMMVNNGQAKLTDFGIAKDLDLTGLTATNCTVGTASYMSPEQCRGDKDISHKSDLYSMGVMFYELVTGRKPFEAESTMDMFLQHVKGKFERPSKFVPELPIWLDTLICQLLEKKTEERPYDAETVARSLEEIKKKVEDQKSAGVERVTLRSIDRQNAAARMDEEDKEAARALMRKRKKKKKVTPIYEKNWFQLSCLLLVVGAMGFLVWFVFIKPPSLDSLHRETKDLMKQEEWARALSGPLQSFRTTYKDSKDPQAKELKVMTNTCMLRLMERQMHNRRANFKSDSAEEKIARKALDEEELGKLADAKETWKELALYVTNWEALAGADEANRDKHAWGLVGREYQTRIEEVLTKRDFLAKMVSRSKSFEGESEEEKMVVKSMRAEFEKNIFRAELILEELVQKTEDDRNKRMWFLMAKACLRELKSQSD